MCVNMPGVKEEEMEEEEGETPSVGTSGSERDEITTSTFEPKQDEDTFTTSGFPSSFDGNKRYTYNIYITADNYLYCVSAINNGSDSNRRYTYIRMLLQTTTASCVGKNNGKLGWKTMKCVIFDANLDDTTNHGFI